MKLNLFEKLILKIFSKTFDKVYKQGLTDCFNFMVAPAQSYKWLYENTKEKSIEYRRQKRTRRSGSFYIEIHILWKINSVENMIFYTPFLHPFKRKMGCKMEMVENDFIKISK